MDLDIEEDLVYGGYRLKVNGVTEVKGETRDRCEAVRHVLESPARTLHDTSELGEVARAIAARHVVDGRPIDRQEVVQAMIRKHPDAANLLRARMPYPRVLAHTIIEMWVRQVHEDADTILIRRAMVALDAG